MPTALEEAKRDVIRRAKAKVAARKAAGKKAPAKKRPGVKAPTTTQRSKAKKVETTKKGNIFSKRKDLINATVQASLRGKR